MVENNILKKNKIIKLFHYLKISLFIKNISLNELLSENKLVDLDFLNNLLPISINSFLEDGILIKNSGTTKYSDNKNINRIIIPKQRCELSIQDVSEGESKLLIINFFFKKISHTNKIFNIIKNNLSSNSLRLLFKEKRLHLDDNGYFYLRLDFQELKKGIFKLINGGDCIHFKFSLAAYPKNKSVLYSVLGKLFEGVSYD